MKINRTKHRIKNRCKPFLTLRRISATTLFSAIFFSHFALAESGRHNAPTHQAIPFSFALIGDLPYDVKLNEKSRELTKLTNQVNQDKSIEWVLHVGDIKTGLSSCTERFLNDRKTRFATFLPPFVLTLGDNEWTDCHRLPAGSFDPLDRLDKLRDIFYASDNHKLKTALLNFEVQSETQEAHKTYIENFYWEKNGISFSTIHIVGSFNGEERFKGRNAAHDREIASRNRAALDWLSYTFEKSTSEQSAGLFIAIHANPGFDADPGNPENIDKYEKAYGEFTRKLFKLAKKFGRPVILAHGDSHTFRVDQPKFIDKAAPKNLFRVETFGETNSSWIKVNVDAKERGVFAFTPIRN